MGQVGIIPYIMPYPHDHTSIPQGGLIASILASITDPAHDHSGVAQGGQLADLPTAIADPVHTHASNPQGGIFPDLWLGASPLIRQASGALTFQTNEGTDTDTVLTIKGKGTGVGRVRAYDENELEFIEINCVNKIGYISVGGTAPSTFHIQYNKSKNVYFWYSIPSGNPELFIHGYKSGVGLKYGKFFVDINGILNIIGEDGLKAHFGAFYLDTLVANNKVPDSDKVDNIEGAELLQRDGSVPLTNDWPAGGKYISASNFRAALGGSIALGDIAGYLRLAYDSAEVAKLLGVSNGVATLILEGIKIGAFELNSLVANNKVPDSDKWGGKTRPGTLADILSDHNKAAHDALGILHSSTGGRTASDHHPQLHEGTHRSGGGDPLGHDYLGGFVAEEHKSLPNTIAQVLSDHSKATHDALKIEGAYLGAPTNLTISGGAITVTGNYHVVLGEGGANDELVTINGGTDGMTLILKTVNDIIDITVKNETGNIEIDDGADFVLGLEKYKLILLYDGSLNMWQEIGRFT